MGILRWRVYYSLRDNFVEGIDPEWDMRLVDTASEILIEVDTLLAERIVPEDTEGTTLVVDMPEEDTVLVEGIHLVKLARSGQGMDLVLIDQVNSADIDLAPAEMVLILPEPVAVLAVLHLENWGVALSLLVFPCQEELSMALGRHLT